jgi:phospholipid N-methyltransferase
MTTKANKKLPLSSYIKQLRLFFAELYTNPKAVGSVWPSSLRLGKLMAAQIPHHKPGYIIEVGGGTGAVTKALLAYGIAEDKIIVIERSASLAAHLRERFPTLTIIEGDATQLRQILPSHIYPIKAIVSSLPLRSLPYDIVEALLIEFHQLLHPTQGYLIQFTYDLRTNNTTMIKGFRLLQSNYIWLNLPPACVQTFTPNSIDEP